MLLCFGGFLFFYVVNLSKCSILLFEEEERMVEPSSFYTRLASRTGFNTSVRHITRTLDILDSTNTKSNIADVVNRLIAEKDFDAEQTQATIHMLLVEKGGYVTLTQNIPDVTGDADALVKDVARWKAVDLVIGYHHPDLGFIVVNPKNPESVSVIAGFRKNELVIVYAGVATETPAARKNAQMAVDLLIARISGKKSTVPAALLNGPFVFVPPKKKAAPKKAPTKSRRGTTKKAASPVASRSAASVQKQAGSPPPAAVPSASKMSALVSVVVSNELFHNGNVEAWKRIIRSYNAKYPNLKVHIYYDGERIVDINTLFKWGKVKHGSCIQFSVAGENIQDLAKLSRYFRQGASPQFEAFLHGSPDAVMNLF